MELNILICGIGGQGAVLLGSFLRNFFLNKYPNALIVGTESRGVSQREGSVITSVRLQTDTKSRTIFSPEIPPMGADIVIALEPLELLRNFAVMNKNTVILTNNDPIIPKSSVKWMFNSSGKEASHVKDHSNPEWLMNRIEQLMKDNPIIPKAKKIPLKPSTFSNSSVGDFGIQCYSKDPRIMDLNFSALILDELETSSQLNLVMLGFLSNFIEELIPTTDLVKFVDYYFMDKKTIERNKKALEFGVQLAQQYGNIKKTM
ncbi:MAG: 2-oxoacid:acceptor oxidoreductase family protein [Promethearchaeota archaeon]